jgi:hypothetical protein
MKKNIFFKSSLPRAPSYKNKGVSLLDVRDIRGKTGEILG